MLSTNAGLASWTIGPAQGGTMEAPIHPFSELFKQLGLPDDPVGDQFITSHSPSRVM
jgi:hypothetical protein